MARSGSLDFPMRPDRAGALQPESAAPARQDLDRRDAGSPAGGFVFLRLVELPAQFLQHIGRTFQRAAARRDAAHRLDLFTHRRLIDRQVAGELGKLIGDQGTQTEDTENARTTTPTTDNPLGTRARCSSPTSGAEDETEQNRQRDGYKYFPAEIQRRNKQGRQDRARRRRSAAPSVLPSCGRY